MKHLISLVFVSLLLIGCQSNEPLSYSDFPHIDHWDDVETMHEATTILYLYSPTCELCRSIEEPALLHFSELQAHVAVYLVHAGLIYGQGQPPVDVESVPTLIILKNGEFHELVRGPNHVLDYLVKTLNEFKN